MPGHAHPDELHCTDEFLPVERTVIIAIGQPPNLRQVLRGERGVPGEQVPGGGPRELPGGGIGVLGKDLKEEGSRGSIRIGLDQGNDLPRILALQTLRKGIGKGREEARHSGIGASRRELLHQGGKVLLQGILHVLHRSGTQPRPRRNVEILETLTEPLDLRKVTQGESLLTMHGGEFAGQVFEDLFLLGRLAEDCRHLVPQVGGNVCVNFGHPCSLDHVIDLADEGVSGEGVHLCQQVCLLLV